MFRRRQAKGVFFEPSSDYWQLTCRDRYADLLLRLTDLLPSRLTLYLEGTSMAPLIASYLEARPTTDPLAVESGTIWPRSRSYHMPMTQENVAGLAELMDRVAEPQVGDHLHAYKVTTAHLIWYELLERFDLADAADRPAKTYSGGMRRRLDLAGALVAEAPVLFLDEPTTGLDPRSRTELWSVIRDLVSRGSTLLLTTQYMEEADQLADDIVVIDHGREIAHGTADELKAMVGGERIEISLQPDASMEDAQRVLTRFSLDGVHVEDRSVTAPISGGTRTLTEALRALDSAGVKMRDAGLRRPTLDDVFLSLTGHMAENGDREATANELVAMREAS